MWSFEPSEGLAACSAKGVPSFLSYFKTLSIGPALRIEPATSRSAVKRSTDRANPAAVIKLGPYYWFDSLLFNPFKPISTYKLSLHFLKKLVERIW